jgi:hypothetical protein
MLEVEVGMLNENERQSCEVIALTNLRRFIPPKNLDRAEGQGRRQYTPNATFIGFFSQVLILESSSRESIRRVQVWASASRSSVPDEDMSACCQVWTFRGLALVRMPTGPWASGTPKRIEMGEVIMGWAANMKLCL